MQANFLRVVIKGGNSMSAAQREERALQFTR
jgi:hypothetical protein